MAPTPTYSGTAAARAFFVLQAAGFAAWWALLAVRPDLRELFRPAGAHDLDLLAFALPDLAIAVPLSLAAAVTFRRSRTWCMAAAWGAAGAVTYAAGYTLAWAVLRDGGWLGVAMMVPTAALGAFFALDVSAPHLPLFRRARRASAAGNVAVTFAYILVFWSFFLVALPAAIAFMENRLDVPAFTFPARRLAAASLLAVASAGGLWSGVTMARRGAGTPLPMDAANRLVVAGPYAWIRNPMIVSSLGQAVAVALWLGSWTTLAYAVSGGLLWNFLVRPAEEADLLQRFGPAYTSYRRQVRCWWPRRRRFEPPAPPQPRDPSDG